MPPLQLSALDHHFAEFINGLDQSPSHELWLAAAMTSAAALAGHVCLDLHAGAGDTILPFQEGDELKAPAAEHWLQTLANCSTIGRPGDYTPLVLDGRGRLYLHRSWDYERQVASSLLARTAAAPFDQHLLADGLQRFFPPRQDGPDWQSVAALAAVSRRLTVISGGPGTGKTFTVARILALLIEQARDQELRVALTAPTGKAAMRLRQSILQAAQHLDLPDWVRERLPDQVQTIHRLLGVIPSSTSFRHNRDHRLECHVLVVDEVSMVDLPLMARLLEALSEEAVLILLGDRDQLASVEAGAVLADICNSGTPLQFSAQFCQLVQQTCGALPPDMQPRPETAVAAPLNDAVIHLQASYRFGADSGIGALSRMINAGEADDALELVRSGKFDDLLWRPLPDKALFDNAFTAAALEGYAPFAHAGTAEAALEELESFRVLSPHRRGPAGISHLNRLVHKALFSRLGERPMFQAAMITGNDYELGLFNGDTAVLMENGAGAPIACFADQEKGLRRLSTLRLPPWEPAFALTVHKSQGSEFDRVLLILPERISEVLSRELLYTAVTRARKRIEIWGVPEVFRAAVARRVTRNSGLRDRLWLGPCHAEGSF